MTHTPGPFAIDFFRRYITATDEDNNMFVVATISEDLLVGDPYANALLFQAAPDLLFAAEQVLKALEKGYYNAPKIISDLRAAIAKAKGER